MSQSPPAALNLKRLAVAAPLQNSRPMSGTSILVVMIDDDPDDFLIVKDLLSRAAYNKYRPVWVSSYEEGLERIKNQDGDIFLIDHKLGEKTGLDLLIEARANKFEKPVIFLTGVEDPELDLLAMEKGATYYVQKGQLSVDHLLERTIRYAIKAAEIQAELRAVEVLRIAKQAAELASQAKTLFLANVSHEIRTPLGAILGFVDLVLDPDTEPADKENYLNIIKRNAQHLLGLVNDLLDLSKMEAGKFDPILEPCDWRVVIREVIATLEPAAAARENQLTFVDNSDLPKWLKTDPRFLRQILINLVGNAIKFTRGGSIEVKVTEHSNFQIEVRDTGVGVDPEQKLRLFEPFTQGEAGLHRKFGGTGLGLHLSRRMAQALNGNVVLAESAPGIGSTFVLTLPLPG